LLVASAGTMDFSARRSSRARGVGIIHEILGWISTAPLPDSASWWTQTKKLSVLTCRMPADNGSSGFYWPPESTTKFVMQAEIVWQMLGSLSGSPMQIGGPDNEQSYLLQQSSQPSRR
jgi:hypothetical protein